MFERTRSILCVVVIASGLGPASVPAAQFAGDTAPAKAALPLDPVEAVRHAFRTHPIVAIGDNHGSVQGHALRLALVRDPRLLGVMNDVVVEFGNARYQETVDRFVRGEPVADRDLRRVWQDTTQIEATWDLPIYEEFFRAVRTENTARQPAQRLRVLLGDPPIDWAGVHGVEDLKKWMDRDEHAVGVIRDQVLAKGRRALLVYGDQHLMRKTIVLDAPDEWANGIVARLEKTRTASVFNVHTETRLDLASLQPDVAQWPRPSLALLAGTPLGRAIAEPGPNRRQVRTEDQFDAVLYLGHPGTLTMAQLSRERCADQEYLAMRSSRLSLLPAPPDAPFDPADRLKAYCAFAGPAAVIADATPEITALVRATIVDAQKGHAEPTRFAPVRRARLTLFVQRYGPRLLGPMGELKSISLVGEATVAGTLYRRYRVEFDKGATTWTIGVSDGIIASMDPTRE